MKMLSVRLDDAEFAALSRLSEQTGETRSKIVKRSIAALVEQDAGKPTAYELALKHGIVGAFKGSPDLSENVSARVKRKLRAQHSSR